MQWVPCESWKCKGAEVAEDWLLRAVSCEKRPLAAGPLSSFLSFKKEMKGI